MNGCDCATCQGLAGGPFVDVVSALAERCPPTGTVVVTWVCTTCHRGWTEPLGHFRPTCSWCGQLAEQRDAHIELPVRASA